MAATYTIAAVGVAPAANKSMVACFNGAGSARIVRLYRAWALNNGPTAVTGIASLLQIMRISTGSGGSAITPTPHDSANEAFPAQIVSGTNMTVTTSDIFRRVMWSYDEASGNANATIDEWECIPALTMLWDVGYNESNVEPLVCREGFGVTINNVTNTVIGTGDFFLEVTLAAV